jgi:ABC-type antimicrobial peptide transport system permease subunit
MALGAARLHVAALILRRAILQLSVGLGVGVGATLAFDRLFTTGGSRLMDPFVIVPTVALMVLVGAAACLAPAASAAQSDPTLALREE